MKETKDKPVRIITFDDLPKKDLSRYGAVGSPTRVERIFAPEVMASNVYVEGTPDEKAGKLVSMLQERKYI
jgi:electron transfer flavoprotein beta subunit